MWFVILFYNSNEFDLNICYVADESVIVILLYPLLHHSGIPYACISQFAEIKTCVGNRIGWDDIIIGNHDISSHNALIILRNICIFSWLLIQLGYRAYAASFQYSWYVQKIVIAKLMKRISYTSITYSGNSFHYNVFCVLYHIAIASISIQRLDL